MFLCSFQKEVHLITEYSLKIDGRSLEREAPVPMECNEMPIMDVLEDLCLMTGQNGSGDPA
jgi:hypothetical protein